MTVERLRATPFHARAVEVNRSNAWENRCGFTLASAYTDVREEALAARFGAVMIDLSWHWRATISGERVAEFVSRLLTRDATALAPDTAMDVLWLNDAGGVRGAGLVVRLDAGKFLLDSTVDDAKWITEAAALYNVKVEDVSDHEAVLAILGPMSTGVLAAAGLQAAVAAMGWQRLDWRQLKVTLSRFGKGYELWCDPDDALIVWDRIAKVGRPFALLPAGLGAMDILDMETGFPRPGRDFEPARDRFSPEPSPTALGLTRHVDQAHVFNGRGGFLAAGQKQVLSGIQFDGPTPAPFATLSHKGREVGRMLGSLYSAALLRAVGFGVVPAHLAAPGTEFTAAGVRCTTCILPFLPIPPPIAPATETPASTV